MYISVFLNSIKKRKQKRGSKALRASFKFQVPSFRSKNPYKSFKSLIHVSMDVSTALEDLLSFFRGFSEAHLGID